MLREIRNVKQKEPGILRRWFSDEYSDLIGWTDVNGVFETDRVLSRGIEASAFIDERVRDYMIEGIAAYRG